MQNYNVSQCMPTCYCVAVYRSYGYMYSIILKLLVYKARCQECRNSRAHLNVDNRPRLAVANT